LSICTRLLINHISKHPCLNSQVNFFSPYITSKNLIPVVPGFCQKTASMARFSCFSVFVSRSLSDWVCKGSRSFFNHKNFLKIFFSPFLDIRRFTQSLSGPLISSLRLFNLSRRRSRRLGVQISENYPTPQYHNRKKSQLIPN